MVTYQYPYKFGYRESNPFGVVGKWSAGWHIGVDLVGTDKRIYPIASGKVQSINAKGSAYGNHVVISHADGFVSLYAHLSQIYVKENQGVDLNTVIGVEGATGNATGSHLHLEVHQGQYKYPKVGEEAEWIQNPLEHIAKMIEKQQTPKIYLKCRCGDLLEAVDMKMIDGTAYGPVRAMFETYGFTVDYDGKDVIVTP